VLEAAASKTSASLTYLTSQIRSRIEYLIPSDNTYLTLQYDDIGVSMRFNTIFFYNSVETYFRGPPCSNV